jgi:transposase
MLEIKLTESEKKELKRFHRSLKDKNSSDRIKAILMLNDGYSGQEIARILILDENTITTWKKRYINRANITDYLFNECHGYTGKLDKKEEQLVGYYVEKQLISDSKEIRLFIEDQFGKRYSKSGTVDLLHRLGFRYKKTTLIPSKMDPIKQAKFKKLYEEFAENIKDDEAIVFMDGMHPCHNAEISKAWIKVGQKKEILSNSGRNRCNLNGAYNPLTQEVFVRHYKTINAETVIEFFKELELFYSNKAEIYAIVDNARYYKNELVQAYIDKSRINMIFLPTYSPNLNLIERFWKLLKKQVINNVYYEHFKDFQEAVLNFCNKSSPDHQAIIEQFVGTKLHLLKPI